MIQPVMPLVPKVSFRGQSVSSDEKKELTKKLAIANAIGISTVTGAVTTAISRGTVSSWKTAGGIGTVTGALAFMFLAPFFLYKSGITSLSKEKDGDTFVKDKNSQKKFISEVDAKPNNLTGKLENCSKTMLRRAV